MSQDADNRLHVFVPCTDETVRHIWQLSGGGWSDWASLGAP
ncbi:hypothetical protein ACFXAF_23255 [Kitasatospora sp. NPDC059463]